VLPGIADAYRRLYAAAASRGAAPAFERAYPMSPATERVLRSAVIRHTAPPRAP
jgi:hypothetical protein